MKIFLPLLDNGNGSVMANFMMCHANAFAGRDAQLIHASDSHANRGMNKVACEFLKSDCDVWLNIDADVLFSRQDVDNILSHPEPLVYGIYPKKQDDTPPCLGTFAEIPTPDERELALVRRCGRGFMLVRRSLLEAMKEDNGGPALRYHNHGEVQWDFFPSGPVTGEMSASGDGVDKDGYPIREWISEDWYFCERARALGVPTLVDVRIALGHEGSKIYRFGDGQVERIKTWRDVPGWFTDADAEAYRTIAKQIPDGGRVAEIGCWAGRSLAALTTFLREEKKGAEIHAIDTFEGTPGDERQAEQLREYGHSVREVFDATMAGFKIEPTVHAADSLIVESSLNGTMFDAVFIDGDHSREAVAADIAAWGRRVRKGGIIAGHDYDLASVREGVQDSMPGIEIQTFGNCWMATL